MNGSYVGVSAIAISPNRTIYDAEAIFNETNDNMNKDDDALMKSIPFGIEDFKELRENDGYFVDKTVLIEDIVTDKTTKVFLFTRPRRFGKSLNMSMLDAFFNLKYKGNTWFDGLKVSDSERCSSEKNRYPVISISLKGLDAKDYDMFINDLRRYITGVFTQYKYILDSDLDKDLLSIYERNCAGTSDISDMKVSLLNLMQLLEAYHHEKVIVIIDEYDHPMQHSYGKDSQEKIIDFMRGMMTNALKTNEALKFGVVTGVMQIAKESIFSGLNNLYVNNVLSENFDECYGFTESEVKEILAYYGHPEKFEECKEWYDGYIFGNAEVYNPWSVINYVKERFKPAAYWGGTSGNDIIETLISNADNETWKEITELGNGGTIVKQIEPTVTMDDIGHGGDAIYSVLVMSGYLNAVADGKKYALTIPNNEMRGVYLKMMVNSFRKNSDTYFLDVFDALREGDIQNVEKKLFDLLDNKIPFFAISKESDYQKILAISAMCTQGKYVTTMESESGNGRVDVKMTSKDVRCPHIIMELKKTESGSPDVWQSEAEGALQQIKDKKYHNGLKGRILLYGICFHGKEAKVVMEEVC